MATILHLETATTNCSVSLSSNGRLIALKERNDANYSHSENLHLFIDSVMAEAGLSMEDIDAVAVSKGPGSYTGLRIGVSAAKGLCFALDIPLISIPTLRALAFQVVDLGYDFIIPLLDARRMEVYSSVFNGRGEEVRETKAEIIDETSFSSYLEKGKTLLIGPGAEKCRSVIDHQNAFYKMDAVPSAKEMVLLSHRQFESGIFEDVAYFEPFYLKDFMFTGKNR